MKVFWFDVETSGTDAKKHGIISLAYIVEINGGEVEHGELFANPAVDGKEIDEAALTINGFSRSDLEDFGAPQSMYAALYSVLTSYVDKYDKADKFIAAGYNVEFDIAFLRELWLRCGDTYFGSLFAFGAIDPSKIVRFLQYYRLAPYTTSGTLREIAKLYGIDPGESHDAVDDIRATKRIVDAIRRSIAPSSSFEASGELERFAAEGGIVR